MPYSSNPPPITPSSYRVQGISFEEWQNERYARLAYMLWYDQPTVVRYAYTKSRHLKGYRVPRVFSAESIYARLKAARVLPRSWEPIGYNTYQKIVLFAWQYLGMRLHVSQAGMESWLFGNSPVVLQEAEARGEIAAIAV
jgi:hypothetical protein